MYRSGVSVFIQAFRIALHSSTGVVIALAMLVCGCGGSNMPDPGDQDTGGVIEPKAGYWGMNGGDQTRRNLSAYAGPDSPTVAWEKVLAGRFFYDPAVSDDGTAYLCAGDVLVAVGSDGMERWRYESAYGFDQSPFVTNSGDIMIVTGGTIICLASNGTVLWQKETQGGYETGDIAFAASGASAFLSEENEEYSLVVVNADGTDRWTTLIDDFEPWPELHINEHAVASQSRSNIRVYTTEGTLILDVERSEEESRDLIILRPDGGCSCLVYDRIAHQAYIELYAANGSLQTKATVELNAYQVEHTDTSGNTYLRIRDTGLVVFSPDGDRHDLTTIMNPVRHIDSQDRIFTLSTENNQQQLDIYSNAGELLETWTSFPSELDDIQYSRDGSYAVAIVEGSIGKQVYGFAIATESSWLYAGGLFQSAQMIQPNNDHLVFFDTNSISICSNSAVTESYHLQTDYKIKTVIANPNGSVFYTTNTGQLLSQPLDAEPELLTELSSSSVLNSCITTQNRLYLNSEEILYCLDNQGERIYAFVADDVCGSPAISSNETAYLQDTSGVCYAIAADGTEIWRYDPGSRGDLPTILASENLLLFSVADGVVAMDASGNELWRLAIDGGETAVRAAVGPDGTMYLPVSESTSPVIDPAQGGTTTDPAGTLRSGNATGSIHSTSASNTLSDIEFPGICAVNSTGEILWYVPMENLGIALVADKENQLYVLERHSTVYSINPDGTIAWTQQVNFWGSSVLGAQLLISGPGQLVALCYGVLTMFED